MRSCRRDDHVAIEAVLTPLLAPDAVLCTDRGGKGPFALAAREMGIAHRTVNLIKGVRMLAGSTTSRIRTTAILG